MGIPRLTGVLSQYAEQLPIHDTQVVIDGPGLAYHIIHICRSKYRGDNPFSQPSYDVLGKSAVTWLDELELRGIAVSALYFDGYLPEDKRPTRLERACRTSKDLNNFYLSTTTGIPRPKTDGNTGQESDAPSLTDNKITASQRNDGIHPAFAVPAVFEALRQSDKYGPMTRLVPGEADSFCADHVRIYGGTLLTSDSDLLVFDLGSRGNVAFFRDIELVSATMPRGLAAVVYFPALISKQLSLNPKYGISALAFEMTMDPNLPHHKLLSRSREAAAIHEYPEEYERFMIPYSPLPTESSGLGFLLPSAFNATIFDARISELVLQFLRPRTQGSESATRPNPSSTYDESDILMFLPQLYESWSRVSAWEISSSLRQLAYGLMQHVARRRIPAVVEHRRLIAVSSRGKLIEVPPLAVLTTMSGDLLSLLGRISDGVGNPELQWIVLSMIQDLEWSTGQDKEALVLRVLGKETQSNGVLDPSSWNAAHLLAQLQATYYSLRILKQILGLVCKEIEKLPQPLYDLLKALSSLPSFSSYPTLNELEHLPARLRESGDLELLAKLAGLSEAIEFRGVRKGSRKNPPGHKRKRSSKQEPVPHSRSQNAFAALALDKT